MAWVNLLNIVYPVNSIYFSYANASPASIVGGSWTQITNCFIRADANTSTGGNSNNFSHALMSGFGASDYADNDVRFNVSTIFTPGEGLFSESRAEKYYEYINGITGEDFWNAYNTHFNRSLSNRLFYLDRKTTPLTTVPQSQISTKRNAQRAVGVIKYHDPPYQNLYCWRRTA